MPRVSIVIPHYNDLARLGQCLDALARQTYPADRLEIIVADNCSPAGPDAVREAVAGRARLVIAKERGAGPARNAGVAASTGDVLAFTDADCLPEPAWLAEGVAMLSRHDLVGGRMIVLVEDDDRVSSAEAFEREFAFENELYVTKKGFSVTANLFCRRDVFEAVGGFRVGVSEDLDWCRRATSAGFRLGYAPAAVVGHPARRDWTELVTKWRRLNVESYHLVRQQPFGRAKWLLRSWALPLSALAHTPRVLRSPRLARGSQRLGALGMLYRLRLWRTLDAHRLLIGKKAN
jgi:GT2 family glycosyltransferase